MKKPIGLLLLLLLFLVGSLPAQSPAGDTLRINSAAFGGERQVVVYPSEFHRYAGEDVHFPVIFILDGQHEWFINPVLSQIRYLQYTHEIPQCIVVTVPLLDRNQECAIRDPDGLPLPLHQFLVDEISPHLTPYQPSDLNVLIGHSFSASFALYSYAQAPYFWTAAIAHTPLNKLEAVLMEIPEEDLDPNCLFLSIGGPEPSKDGYHRTRFDAALTANPAVAEQLTVFRSEFATHNALPIVATPHFLTQLFHGFSLRFADIAQVDLNYQLVEAPGSVDEEMELIRTAARVMEDDISLEIPEVNGMTSRYLAGDALEVAQAIYAWGNRLYPKYFEFYLYLAEIEVELKGNANAAEDHLVQAEKLLATMEQDSEDLDYYREEVARIRLRVNTEME